MWKMTYDWKKSSSGSFINATLKTCLHWTLHSLCCTQYKQHYFWNVLERLQVTDVLFWFVVFFVGGGFYSLQDVAPFGAPLPVRVNENTSILLVRLSFGIIPNKIFV